MEIIYRAFFFVASMALLMAFTLPWVLLARLLMRRHERKYVMWEWRLLYLRSVCPFAMTSLLFVIPGVSHYYYLLLNRLGFDMKGNGGMVFHWSDIFRRSITATTTFKGCSIIWVAGVVILLLHLALTQRNLRRYFAKAGEIGENIYESSAIELPVQLGVFRKRLYLPKGFQTAETTWLLRHMESRKMEPMRRFLVVFITVVYWFNPVMWLYYYLWSRDNEIWCDEKLTAKGSDSVRRKYAQAILNFRKRQRVVKDGDGHLEEKKSPSIYSFLTIFERNPEGRAKRMMYQKWYASGGSLSAYGCLLATIALLFCLTPLQRVWMEDGKTASGKEEKSAEKIFEDGKNLVIAKGSTQSPNGLNRAIQLEMGEGEKDGSEGYQGKFSLVMYDDADNKIDSMDMDEVFSRSAMKSYHFSEGLGLEMGDFNGDGVQEIILGQKQALTETEFDKLFEGEKDKPKIQDSQVCQFSLVNVEEKELKVLQEGIISVSMEKDQRESVQFEAADGVEGVFAVPMGNKVQYYQWNKDRAAYEAKDYTEEDVEKLKKESTDGNGNSAQGEAKDHTLAKEDGGTAIMVSTKRDSTSSEEIQSVTLSPRGSQVQFTDVKGYYCDLLWVPAMGENAKRYAQLIYNGTKSRTFVVYDTQRKTVYYSQEDGTENLGKLFRQFKENDISFSENSAAIYTLKEKNNDTLKIEFSAEAEGGVKVRGSYEYNVLKKKSANLSFTRSVNHGESTAAPTAEPE